jgi:hypothetical protein
MKKFWNVEDNQRPHTKNTPYYLAGINRLRNVLYLRSLRQKLIEAYEDGGIAWWYLLSETGEFEFGEK